jgi:hypothetical protein
VLIIVFEIAIVLILRAHYTMDVFTGIVTGRLCCPPGWFDLDNAEGQQDSRRALTSTDGLEWITEQQSNSSATRNEQSRTGIETVRMLFDMRRGFVSA